MKHPAIIFILLLTLLVDVSITNCIAQTNSQRGLNAPRLMVKDENTQGSEYPLELSKLDVSVIVVGNIVTTTMEMTFHNSTHRVLEGELVFPLGEGQTVSRFALDINGKLREGVVVDKQKGQQVFEAVVRKNIDPGLLEKTQGNNFRARVYPIPANGYKKALIAFESELLYFKDGYLYLLPMNFDNKIGGFNLHIEVVNQDIEPTVSKNEFENITFKQWRNSYITDYQQQNYLPNKQIGFTIPFQKSGNITYIDKGKVARDNYFYLNIFPKNEERVKVLPKKITMLWDVSSSMKDRDIDAEIKLLKKYLDKIQNTEIEFVPFSNDLESRKTYKIANGNIDELIKDINSLAYDGGTQLGAIDLNKFTCDEFLLFTDGVSNFGKNEILLSKTPVITVSSSQTTEYSYLQYITSATAGIYINLKKITADQALEFLVKQKLHFISAEFENNQISGVYPSTPTYFTNNFSVSGKLLTNTATIKLNFGFGKEIVHTETISVNSNNISDKGLIERVWAQKRINELSLNPTKNNDEISAVGKKFSIVTSNTSLIVLDRVEDYVQYKITPPEELLEEYNNLIGKQVNDEKKSIRDHIDQVVNQFNQKVEWWKKDFKAPDTLKIKKGIVTQSNIYPARQYSTQTKTISGRVISYEDTMPIPGVSVVIKGTNVGVITNVEGEFQLIAPINAILQVSFIGMKTTEVDASNLNNLEITLEAETASLEEVVVTGFGTRERDNRTQAVEIVMEEVMDEENTSLGGGKSDKKQNSHPSIEINKWDPSTPYITELKSSKDKDLYEKYLQLKPENLKTPSFYLDAAEYFIEKDKKKEAIKILSNIAELELENHELLRTLARKLQQIGEIETAICIFKDVVKLRPEEPQSFRDLGLAYASNKEYQKATDILYSIVEKNWDGRFPGIEVIVIGEMNAIIEQANGKINTEEYDSRFLKNLPVDVRVVLNWDANNTDIDLWVTDPFNDKCFYSHPLTRCGGYMSRDFTGGYGPEEFLIKKAPDGKYKVQINYYGTSQQTIQGPVNIQIQMFTNYGTKQQEVKEVTMRLAERKEVIDIGNLLFGNRK